MLDEYGKGFRLVGTPETPLRCDPSCLLVPRHSGAVRLTRRLCCPAGSRFGSQRLARFNGLGFDDNMVGLTAGAQNVCMLAAFGNAGTVLPNCIPIFGTQAMVF